MRDTFVYRCYDRRGVLLYIGVTAHLKARWHGHRSGSPWAAKVATCRVVGPYDRSTALQVEADAIRHERPSHNKVRPISAAEDSMFRRRNARLDELAEPWKDFPKDEYAVALRWVRDVVRSEIDPMRDGTCRAYQLSRGAA